jgi:hypothetical protein
VTGTSLGLRRWSGCNLHWYGPKFGHKKAHYTDPAPRLLRYRLYVPDEQYTPNSRYHRDRYGTFVYMWPDCGWEWLYGRTLSRLTRLDRLFYALHEHVHTPHKEARMNLPLEIQRSIVSNLERLDGTLDRIPAVEIASRDDETVTVKLYRNGLWGCRTPLSRWSSELDERWGTGVWVPVEKWSVAAYFFDLSESDEKQLRNAIASSVDVDRQADRVRVTWTEGAKTAQDALQDARDAVNDAKIEGKVSFTWPTRLS